jgi:triosephosphate isomerase
MKFLAGNWKLNKTKAETRAFFTEALPKIKTSPTLRYVVATSPTLIETAVAASASTGGTLSSVTPSTSKGAPIDIFSQNVAFEKSGAFTGEVSTAQLKDVGATGTLVGHSERRTLFGDTDQSCLRRAARALEDGLEVIYCIGETLDERQGARTLAVLQKQIGVLRELKVGPAELSKIIIAYEPVWAIGTGLNATTAQIIEAHGWIAAELNKVGLGGRPILYGGSVKPNNFKEIGSAPGVSGGLVGGASLEPKSFLDLADCLLA